MPLRQQAGIRVWKKKRSEKRTVSEEEIILKEDVVEEGEVDQDLMRKLMI